MGTVVPIYQSQAEAYRAEYGAYISRTATIGAIAMVDLAQTPGDFSDAPTGDLQIMRTLSRVRCHLDLGAGKRSVWHEPGVLSVNPPGFANTIILDHHHRVDVACIPWASLVAQDVEGVLPAGGDFGHVHARANRDPSMTRVFDQLWQSHHDAADSLTGDVATAWIAQRLIDWAKSPTPTERKPVEQLTPRALSLCKERLEAPGADAATLAELAAICRLSPHHFCRAFKSATGLPPHRYQIVARIERARALLLETRLPVAEIGLAVGYDDPSYFSRLFTRETGSSPRAWRREACL